MTRRIANDESAIDAALRTWRQGDVSLDAELEFVHVADLSRPHTEASIQAASTLSGQEATASTRNTPISDEVPGFVLLSQTCDLIRKCRDRPYAEVAPLVKVPAALVEEVRRLKRPMFAYVPAMANDCLVADIDRTMTVEKAVVASWTRIPGWEADNELRDFAHALSRKRVRFAFPDDFVDAAQKLQKRLTAKHDRQAPEGAHLRVLREIRVRAAPSWTNDHVELFWWFIKDRDPESTLPNWSVLANDWTGLFDQNGRFHVGSLIVCTLDDITARDYVDSDPLDLDRLSVSRQH